VDDLSKLARETSRKLITRVACDTYDYEMAYIKNVLKGLKMNLEDVTRLQTGMQRMIERRGAEEVDIGEGGAEEKPLAVAAEEEVKESASHGLSSELIQQLRDLIEERPISKLEERVADLQT